MKKRIPVLLLITAPYCYWGQVVYFLYSRGGLSTKALFPILCFFVFFLFVIEIPCLLCSFRQIKKGVSAKEMLVSGCVMLGAMIPIWAMSVMVSIAIAKTILLSVLIPLIVLIDCVFTIPGILLTLVGGIRWICCSSTVRKADAFSQTNPQ